MQIVPGFDRLRRVASDCRPWPSGGLLGVCGLCATVQKLVDQEWRNEAKVIYSQYDIYHQSPGGAEQVVFDQNSGASSPRSKRILEFVMGLSPFPVTGRMIDIGCGNGAMLRAFSTMTPDWELNGFEPNLRSRGTVLSIPGVKEIYSGSFPEVPGTFDFISIIHTLEHIENPVSFLTEVREKLAPEGWLLIEVPYFPDNPFDLLIADHCTHFSVATLLSVLVAAGLEAVSICTDIVAKEMTALARQAAKAGAISAMTTSPSVVGENYRTVEIALHWFETVLAEARTIADKGKFGLFGTSISANWLFGELENWIEYFVEEDPNRIGTIYRGRPVRHPADVPQGGNVYMVLPRPLAAQIVHRINPVNAHFHLPPLFEGTIAESPYAT